MRPDAGPGRAPLLSTVLPLLGLLVLGILVWEVDVLRPATRLAAFPNYDLFAEFQPRHSFAGEALRRGELPLWDSHQIAGHPFLATLQGGVLYPPNLLYAVLPTGRAMGLLSVFHLILAGGFAFLLARELGRSRTAAWLAGLVTMLGGSSLFLIYQTNAINSLPWLPAALYCAARLGREGSQRWALLLALCASLQFLAGRDYTFVMTAHAVAFFAVFQLFWMMRDGAGARRMVRHVAQLGFAAVLAAGLVAVQLLPTLALAAQSGRTLGGLEGEFLEIYGPLPPAVFLANLVNPVRGAIRREYLGWLPLLCFLLGFRLWGRDRAAVFASATALLSLLLCFGSQTPLYGFYRELPLGSLFRLPSRFAVLFSLALALGAACGLDRLCATASDRRARVRALAPGLLLVLGFGAALWLSLASGWLEKELALAARPWGWFWLYGVSLDHFADIGRGLAYFGAGVALLGAAVWWAGSPFGPALRLAIPTLAAVDLAFAVANPFVHPARAAGSAGSGAACYQAAAAITGEFGRHLSFRLLDSYGILDKDGERFGTYSATHYEPLVTLRHAAFFAALQAGGTPLVESPWNERSAFMGFLNAVPTAERARLLDLMGVKAVLVDGRPGRRPPALDGLLERFERAESCSVATVSGRAPVAIYSNPHALPRAFVVHRVSSASSPERALQRLVAPDFDPLLEAVVEGGPSLSPAPGRAGADGRAAILSYADGLVAVRVQTRETGLLVLTDAYDPDWHATLNGDRVDVYPTDGLFRGVAVPPGDSEVVFHYDPVWFRRGAVISALTAVLSLALWVSALRRRERPG